MEFMYLNAIVSFGFSHLMIRLMMLNRSALPSHSSVVLVMNLIRPDGQCKKIQYRILSIELVIDRINRATLVVCQLFN